MLFKSQSTLINTTNKINANYHIFILTSSLLYTIFEIIINH